MSETPRVDRVHWNHAFLKEEAYKLERELNASNDRIRLLISQRDSALRRAEQQWKVREDLQAELGTSDPAEAVLEIRKLKAKLKAKERKPAICSHCMEVECECSDFDVSADMGARG